MVLPSSRRHDARAGTVGSEMVAPKNEFLVPLLYCMHSSFCFVWEPERDPRAAVLSLMSSDVRLASAFTMLTASM